MEYTSNQIHYWFPWINAHKKTYSTEGTSGRKSITVTSRKHHGLLNYQQNDWLFNICSSYQEKYQSSTLLAMY